MISSKVDAMRRIRDATDDSGGAKFPNFMTMNLFHAVQNMSGAERDRLTAAEICIDEALTLLERRSMGATDPLMLTLLDLSRIFHDTLTVADGLVGRRQRILKVRAKLTELMPLTDADLGVEP